ncbi:MAG: CDP-alcohol phosphatidyltransferase family protein [Candidatus Sungbacteria bacterium]|nr:CDP-alcohol phosphatidyltransferase family protein [Candidatus Sungbacteria bacterium]
MTGNFHYFSSKEEKHQERFRLMRDKILRVFLKPLIWLHISPNMLTFVSFISLGGFFYFFIDNPWFSIIFLFAHVLLDGVDGPLARATGKSSRAGSFLDMLNDHTGMVIVVATVIHYSMLDSLLGLTYVYTYSLLIVFILYQNSLGVPPSIVFRSKYLFYALYMLWALSGINIFNVTTAIFILFTSISLVAGGVKIFSILKSQK